MGFQAQWIFAGIKRGFQAKIRSDEQFDEQVSYYKKKIALRQGIRRHFKKQAEKL